MGVTISSCNSVARCKEDLELDEDPHHQGKLKTKLSIEAATSGTESEKYYSGDSEPDFEEKNGFGSMQQNANQSQNADNNNSIMPPPPPRSSGSGFPSSSSTSSSQMSVKTVVPGNSHAHGRNRKTSPKLGNGSLVNAGAGPGSGSVGGPPQGEIISSTVDRLNRDVDHILARLRILETAYAASVNVSGSNSDLDRRGMRRGRPRFFGGLSYSSIVFIMTWPFAVHFLIKLMGWWWARRRRLFAIARNSRLQ